MNFAVIKTGGKQYLVKAGDKILIEKVNRPAGEEFDFEEVFMVGDGSTGSPQAGSAENTQIGKPLVEDARVRAKIIEQGRAAKKIVFKFTHKTRYKKKKGHRQPFTKVEILRIIL